jgi:polygalacturonase
MTDRRHFLQTSLIAGAALLAPSPVFAKPANQDPWRMVKGILARIKPPVFPSRDFPITDFGAVGDGAFDCTEAIAKAISACHTAGGGRVVVPAGRYLTGAIHLKSNVNLHVAKGATIKFSRDPKKYLPLVYTRWEGVELMNYSPLIYAFEQENVAVTGEGVLDGQASNEYWWPWKGPIGRDRENGGGIFGWKPGMPYQVPARNKLFEMGETDVPVAQRIFGEGSYLRPNFFEPYRCKNVLIEGVTLLNAPFWQVHPVLCTNVTVRGLTIDSNGPNTDGCDPDACRDVLIENCSFNTGDDCIAINSGRNRDGRRVGVPTENVIIRNCRMKDGHGAVAIGSGISGGVRYVFVENCTMDSPTLGSALRFKNNALRGGVLEHFYFRHITIGQVAHAALTIDFNYEEGGRGPHTPILRDVQVDGLVCKEARYAIDLQGLPNGVVEGVALSNFSVVHAEQPNIVKYVKGLTFKHVTVNGKALKA